MKITIMIEGQTETVFIPVLRKYLLGHLAGRMPKLDPLPYDGRIKKGEKLRAAVKKLLRTSDAVLALTDVYTGNPREFDDANHAKQKMREWVGKESRFFPHAAQYEFEAWLLPYWADLVKLAGHNASPPGANPENVNHDRPPSKRLAELFAAGSKLGSYSKTRDARRILDKADLSLAIDQCPELKAFINTILTLCEASPIA